jgi:Ser/Thr protein kinase RdoA (MazF antagonist)
MSDLSREQGAAAAFDLDGVVTDIRPLGHGLINDTFLVTLDTEDERRVVLQRINRRAFPQPELIMQNLRVLTEHVRAHNLMQRAKGPELWLPEIVRARDGRDFVVDAHGDFWRVLDYIEDSASFESILLPGQAEEVGSGLGRFHALVADLDPSRLQVTRPGFHQTPLYYEKFMQAAARVQHADSVALEDCIAFAKTRAPGVAVLEEARRHELVRPRVVHGDPKLNNFLFSPETGHVMSLIDLDTVQPGLVHYDIGDCLRSVCNPAGESPQRLDDVRFDLDICQAWLKHYLAEARAFLTAQDIAHLYDAIRLIPFELGLRFLTDHINGDVYFKTDWRGHNLHRAQAQFQLVADIESNERRIRSLIAAMG